VDKICLPILAVFVFVQVLFVEDWFIFVCIELEVGKIKCKVA